MKRMELGVNIDHVATLRNARGTNYPEPAAAAALAELAGADQITIHLREDRRHITDRDLTLLRQTVMTRLNLEMAATEEMVGIATSVHPDQVTLVPERREEVTTEGGLDVVSQVDLLEPVIARLRESGIKVSLFIDPDPKQVKASRRVGADAIEIHTGEYTHSFKTPRHDEELQRIVDAARIAHKLKLFVAAGHGLDYHNVYAIAAIPEITELNIGHSIVSRAVMEGMGAAVATLRARIAEGRASMD